MSTATISPAIAPAARSDRAARVREYTRAALASAQVRRSKVWLAAALAVIFWFSVPYSLPRHLPGGDAATMARDNADQFDGSIARQVAVPLLALAGCFMLWRYPIRGKIGGRLFIVVCLYAAWTLSSLAWSEDPLTTAKRLSVFCMVGLFAYAVARTLTILEMALGAAIAMFLAGALSLFADIFLLHDFAPFDPDYRLMGVMSPNHQAMNLVACCLCTVTLLLRRPRWGLWLSPMLGFTLALLWLTRARIGTILCIVLVSLALYRFIRERYQPHARAVILLLLLMVAAPLLTFAVGSAGAGAAQSAFMMGRNDTQNTGSLSNRLPLWQELMDSVEQHPWLGFGYGAFWTSDRAAKISADQGWPVPHAHNTYLDQVIVLGYVGGALYLGVMVTACVVAWRRYLRLRSSGNLLNAMLLTWLVLLNTSESAPLEPHMPTILVYIAVLRMCLRENSVDNADPVSDLPIVQGLPVPPDPLLLHMPAPAVTRHDQLAASKPRSPHAAPLQWRHPASRRTA